MNEVEQHYTHGQLEQCILRALERAGKDSENLSLDDLAPIDEFHIRGRAATRELAQAISLDRGMDVLDIGCGLGGPSRHLAAEYGCRFVGLDLTEEYCRVAEALTARLGLQGLVSFRRGDALKLPYEHSSFDVVWTQHASMNIGDKVQLYGEMYRTLKPGGHLAIYDILAGSGAELYFPVPWAREPSISFLPTADELHGLLRDTGFDIISWQDTTVLGLSWFATMAERIRREGRLALGYHILLGGDFPVMARNQMRNLDEGRIVLMQVVARRPAQ
ncbi:class I SAM-dependent methyltransferase [Halomonas sp. 328]|uniref:class I SAM-dependent methyltransferase n=1 Tax=Halomonas sp. 328 TaxID=2776704 RepID=UPI0018A71D36|nr:methyltransferase domain-containing protein [Halomonas sp. 328]MBF8223650.1 class I SAM-dependent methyltransferase [Halomonas sp. 328]